MSVTPNRGLTLMEPSQAQPEIVFNENMQILDDPTSGGGGGGSLTVDTLTAITKITFSGPAVSVAPGVTGEAVVTVDTISGGSGGGASNITPDTHPFAPDAMDDEFEGTTLDAKWTWYHQNTASVSFEQGAVKFVGTINGSEDVALIGQPLPGGGPWRFRAKLSALTRASANNVGVYLHETGSGKIVEYGLINLTGTPTLWVENAASFTAGGAISFSAGLSALWPLGVSYPTTPMYFEIELASGTLHFRLSNTGYEGTFVEVYSVTQTTLFTTTPNVIGLGGYSFNGSTPSEMFCDWFRRMA